MASNIEIDGWLRLKAFKIKYVYVTSSVICMSRIFLRRLNSLTAHFMRYTYL